MTARAVTRRALGVVLLGVVLLAVSAIPVAAHPLGNFTTNTYAGVLVSPEQITVDYVLDLAEIRTVRTKQQLGAGAQSAVPADAAAEYERRECDQLAAGLKVAVDGDEQSLQVASTDLSFPPGEAGLDTLRLECELVTPVADLSEDTPIAVRDRNFPDRPGWRETVAAGDRVTLTDTNVPTESVSERLTAYPEARLQAPLERREARLVATPGGSPATIEGLRTVSSGAADAAERVYTTLTSMVSVRELTVPAALVSGLVAVLLGGLHALAPGHGKTVMAAFLVGHDARSRQALGLGATVALTHTVGVLLLGFVLSVTDVAAPERAFPWLGMASGLMFAGVGAWMLRRALKSRGHHHAPHHHISHHHVSHHHSHAVAADSRSRLHWRNLIAPGLAGGLVPTPSALVVLLGGVAIGRAWFGVTLVVAYGVGMALTLVGIGYALLRARQRVTGWLEREAQPGAFVRGLRFLPVVTSALVVVGGLAIATRFAVIL